MNCLYIHYVWLPWYNNEGSQRCITTAVVQLQMLSKTWYYQKRGREPRPIREAPLRNCNFLSGASLKRSVNSTKVIISPTKVAFYPKQVNNHMNPWKLAQKVNIYLTNWLCTFFSVYACELHFGYLWANLPTCQNWGRIFFLEGGWGGRIGCYCTTPGVRMSWKMSSV